MFLECKCVVSLNCSKMYKSNIVFSLECRLCMIFDMKYFVIYTYPGAVMCNTCVISLCTCISSAVKRHKLCRNGIFKYCFDEHCLLEICTCINIISSGLVCLKRLIEPELRRRQTARPWADLGNLHQGAGQG